MLKHAYLIMAHNDPYVFHKLISLLDDERNDIFVHIDKKSDLSRFNNVKTEKSNLYFTDRIDNRWGAFTQIETELLLFRTARMHSHYSRYHLLSGVDLPLKTQDEIHNFFNAHANKEFIGFTPQSANADIRYKTGYYHILLKYYKNKRYWIQLVARSIHILFVDIQKVLRIHRRFNFEIRKGANWISITELFVDFVLSREKEIRKVFHFGWCTDELFLQTLIWNSPLKNRIYNVEDEFQGCMRLIDWQRGTPYVWRSSDFSELTNSKRMFARKFSSDVDKEIIDRLYTYLKNKSR